MAKAVIYRKHTLGLLRGGTLEVLNGFVSKGGKHFTDSPISVFEEECQPASLQDFKRFNVRYHSDYEIENKDVVVYL